MRLPIQLCCQRAQFRSDVYRIRRIEPIGAQGRRQRRQLLPDPFANAGQGFRRCQPLAGVQALVDFMADFSKRHG